MEKKNNMYECYWDLTNKHKNALIEIIEVETVLGQQFDVGHFKANTHSNTITIKRDTVKSALRLHLKGLKEHVVFLEEKILEEMKLIVAKNKLINEAVNNGEQMSLKELFGE